MQLLRKLLIASAVLAALTACAGGPLTRSDVARVRTVAPGRIATEPASLHPAGYRLPATVVTIKETCHELTGDEFGFANGTGRLDANTVRIVFSSWLSGNVRIYVDGVYRMTEYLDRNLQNSGYPLSITFANTRLQHDYAAWQSADLGFHYPNTPTGYQYTWSSTGIYGVVAVGANHCQTQTEAVG